MLANIAHDMVVCVQQPMFTEMFGASYRYSGAPVIRLLVWLAVDLHLLLPLHSSLTLPGTGIASPFICWAGCLISAMTALLMKDNQRS